MRLFASFLPHFFISAMVLLCRTSAFQISRAIRAMKGPQGGRPSPWKMQSSTTDKYRQDPPKPRKFAIRPDKALDIATASAGLVFRLGSGALVNGYRVSFEKADTDTPKDAPQTRAPSGLDEDEYTFVTVAGRKTVETNRLGKRPAVPLELYEFEGCPFCRKVREAVSILDLDVLFYPCPKDGKVYRPRLVARAGKSQFPYLVDPNEKLEMYESDDIIQYLFDTYSDGKVPLFLRLGPFTTITCGLGLAPRLGKGSRYIPSKSPREPLILWGYEGSPFVKIVREVLSSRELPHLMKFCARGSPKRSALLKKTGTFQVPYLEDPNTGVKMFESAEIVNYLNDEYGVSSDEQQPVGTSSMTTTTSADDR
mmetsp:Transcript_114/g.314  ORF Transcript_114/g.314 Transcript_114/m.314 type:complete len:367 (+) Transcript_114:44-1144(+)